jgi:hypothetical protein
MVFLLFWAVILFISAKDLDVFNNTKMIIVGIFMVVDVSMIVFTMFDSSCIQASTFSGESQSAGDK